nr:cytochrome c family protein [Chelativorans sp. Marseille-P2723]
MDSFELNKIIGAVLGTIFIIFSVSLLSGSIFHSPAPETPGYAIAVPEGDEGGGGAAEPAAESVLPLLASADPSAGESVFRRCQACHTVDEGGANRVGPNLWGVVNNAVAAHEGFSYSAALEEFSQGGQETWTYENLDHFLLNPRGFIPGTAMAFAGLRNVEDRADVIAYLRTLSNDPAPLPEAAPADEGEQPAESEAPGAEDAGEAAPAGDATETAPAEETAPAQGVAPDGNAAPAEDAAPADTGAADDADAGDAATDTEEAEEAIPPAQ